MLVVSLDPNQGEELDKLAALNKVLLRYHSPNCGHCTEMEPEWRKVEKDKRLENTGIAVVDANVGIVDTTKHPSAKDVSKKGVPTIYLIEGNKMVEHEGGRSADEIVSFALKHKGQNGGKKKLTRRKRKSLRKKKSRRGQTKKRVNKKRRKTKRNQKRKAKAKTKGKK